MGSTALFRNTRTVLSVGLGLVAILAALIVAPAGAQTTAPTLDADPDVARAGESVQADGCGHAAGETVTIFWSRTEDVVGSAETDSDGCFVTTVTLPSSAQVGHRGLFSSSQSGSAETPVRVVDPKMRLEPAQGVAGSSVTAAGCGWLDERQITIVWEPTGTTLATPGGGAGCFETEFTIPEGASASEATLSATQGFTDDEQEYTLRDDATFTVNPTMSLVTSFTVEKRVQPFVFEDLGVHDVELTQAIQCFDTSEGLTDCADNSLTLVHDKRTGARIYLSYQNSLLPQASASNVQVRFHIRPKGASSFQSVVVTGSANPTLDRGDESVPYATFRTHGGGPFDVEYYVEVDPNDDFSEFDESNNRFPASGYATKTFDPSDTLRVDGRRLDWDPSGSAGPWQAGGWSVTGGGADWMEAITPVGDIRYGLLSGMLDWTGGLGSNDQHDLIEELNRRWIRDHSWSIPWLGVTVTPDVIANPDPDHLYGWIPDDQGEFGHADMPVYPHAGGYGVVGIGTDGVPSSPGVDNPGPGSFIFGHEVIHDYDLFHTNTSDACGSSDGSSDFPYSSSSIQEYGFNPASGDVYDPSGTHDVMSYCPAQGSSRGWIAPFTWEKMFTQRNDRDSTGVTLSSTSSSDSDSSDGAMFQQASTDDSVVVDLTIPNSDTAGSIDHAEIVANANMESTTDATSGTYAIQVRDGTSVLFEKYFTPNFDGEYDGHGTAPPGNEDGAFNGADEFAVSFVLPWDSASGADRVVLRDTSAGTDVDTRLFSANAPTVEVTDPSTEEIWAADTTETVSWNADDADGDALTSSLYFRHAPDEDWTLLVRDTTATSVDLPVNDLAGGDEARFRVVVSDGLRTAVDTSAKVSIPDKDPYANITNPASGERIPAGKTAVLRGVGLDLEDGELPTSSHVWSSSRDGALGSGKELTVEGLSPGTHTISLTVTDSSGNEGIAETTLHVSSVGTPTTSPSASDEGQEVVVAADFSDPSPGGTYTCTVDHGDGEGPRPGSVSGSTCTGPGYTYEFDGTYTVTVEVRDEAGRVGTSTAEHTVQDVAGRDVMRHAGRNRFETAAATSSSTFDPGAPVAYVATGTDFADALAGGPTAALTGGPILLTAGDSLPDSTRSELERLTPGRIVVLGGHVAVPDSVVEELRSLTDGSVERFAGRNRFETAADISTETFPADIRTVYVATGLDFADALAGGPSAAVASAPTLLVADVVPDSVRDQLSRLQPDRIVVLGGGAAVPDSVISELESFVGD